MAKASRKNSHNEHLTVTVGVLGLVFLGTLIYSNAPSQAAFLPGANAVSSESSSKSMTAREAALARRLKRAAATRKKPAASAAKADSSSSSSVMAAPARESARLIRTKVAPSDPAGVFKFVPSAIPEKAGCGDGMIIAPETCDDKNTKDGDGCNASCTIETGYYCNPYTLPSVCEERCGNGKRSKSETCDDGNTHSYDGCDQYCKIEYTFTCTTDEPNVCTTVCGDNNVLGSEQCDDGNTVNGDGCSSTCFEEE